MSSVITVIFFVYPLYEILNLKLLINREILHTHIHNVYVRIRSNIFMYVYSCILDVFDIVSLNLTLSPREKLDCKFGESLSLKERKERTPGTLRVIAAIYQVRNPAIL